VRGGRPGEPSWLTSVEMLGTTVVVLMIGGMVLWYTAAARESRLVFTIGSGLLAYTCAVVAFGRRTARHVVLWPFALAGLCAGVVMELVAAEWLLSREAGAAALTGITIGTAHWAALRVWLRLGRAVRSE
jgi:hypothetical protein